MAVGIDVGDLTSLDLRCMEALTTTRTSASVVTVAATMWEGWADADMHSDPVGLVQLVVEGLAERGLVTYRVHERGAYSTEPRPWAGLAHTIRLSKDGWTLMGYPNVSVQVGTRMYSGQMLEEKGDRTNHRTHRSRAEGGDIETLPWPEHRAKYPDHTHPLMTEENDMTTPIVGSVAPSRGYIKVTPDLEARVIAYRTRFPLVDYKELSDMLDIPVRTIQYVLTELPRLRAANGEGKEGTLKQRILWTLDALDMDNVAELRRVLGRADTDHDIVHVLHSLHKEGKVDFKEKGASKEPINIHLTARGRGAGLPKVVKAEIGDAPEALLDAPMEVISREEDDRRTNAEAKVKAEESPFPLLDALLDREQKRQAEDNAAFKYLEAAEAIKDVDPEMYSALVSKADTSIPFPSPIEAEYLKYVAACPGKVDSDD